MVLICINIQHKLQNSQIFGRKLDSYPAICMVSDVHDAENTFYVRPTPLFSVNYYIIKQSFDTF